MNSVTPSPLSSDNEKLAANRREALRDRALRLKEKYMSQEESDPYRREHLLRKSRSKSSPRNVTFAASPSKNNLNSDLDNVMHESLGRRSKGSHGHRHTEEQALDLN